LGVAQAVTGGRIDASVIGEAEAQDLVERGMAIGNDAGFEVEPMLVIGTA
jgi:hypothetical protein